MIFTSQDSVGPESDQRTPVIDLGLARPWAVEWTLLILLGASVLALRAFRENYFKIWVLAGRRWWRRILRALLSPLKFLRLSMVITDRLEAFLRYGQRNGRSRAEAACTVNGLGRSRALVSLSFTGRGRNSITRPRCSAGVRKEGERKLSGTWNSINFAMVRPTLGFVLWFPYNRTAIRYALPFPATLATHRITETQLS
jgi:hypothetical protein